MDIREEIEDLAMNVEACHKTLAAMGDETRRQIILDDTLSDEEIQERVNDSFHHIQRFLPKFCCPFLHQLRSFPFSPRWMRFTLREVVFSNSVSRRRSRTMRRAEGTERLISSTFLRKSASAFAAYSGKG